MNMLDVALSCIARGWHVFPCKPGTKEPAIKRGFLNATNDEPKVRDWWARWPEANVAIATGPSGLTVLDCDHGISDWPDVLPWLSRVGLPLTYAVRTGRKDSYGLQLYYNGPPLKSIAWEDGDHSGDIRSGTGYVMAAGCLHPSGDRYTVAVDMELRPVPLYVQELRPAAKSGTTGGTNEVVVDDGGPITDHRNVAMISLLGKRRADGADDDELEAYAHEVNEARMVPPLDESELGRLIANALRFEPVDPGPAVTLGGKTTAEVVELAKPVDWRTHYHTLDEMENAPPASFLIEGFLQLDSITALAAPVGQRKSLVALNVAHALCTGADLFGYFKVTRRPTRVLYLCPEMGLQSFTVRLRKIGLLPYVGETLFCRTMSAAGTLTLDELVPEELVGAVVVIDTAVRYLQGDENSSEHMRAFAEGVFRLMRDGAASVLLLHHSAKGTKETNELTLENAMRGSGELGAFVTSCWATRLQNPSEPYQSASYIVNVKQRDFESKPFEVTGGPDCRLHIVAAPGEAVLKGRNSGDRDGKEDVAVRFIRDNPAMSIREVVAQLKEQDIVRGKTWVADRRAEIAGTGVRLTAA